MDSKLSRPKNNDFFNKLNLDKNEVFINGKPSMDTQMQEHINRALKERGWANGWCSKHKVLLEHEIEHGPPSMDGDGGIAKARVWCPECDKVVRQREGG